MSLEAVIFDLDGVIIHTDSFHYMAWKEVADANGLQFDEVLNNRLRGVSRAESLEIILRSNGISIAESMKHTITETKNEMYRRHLDQLTPESCDQTVVKTLQKLKARGIKIAIGSSSKNAPFILRKIGLFGLFDTISDGNGLKNSKPDPEVFLKASHALHLSPSQCVVIEDAEAGIDAAKAGGFLAVGIGDASSYPACDYAIDRIDEVVEILAGQ